MKRYKQRIRIKNIHLNILNNYAKRKFNLEKKCSNLKKITMKNKVIPIICCTML